MSFYYEAEPAKWTYKDRYNWTAYPPKVCRKLESLYQKVQKGDESRVEVDYESDNIKWKINVQHFQAIKQGSHNYYNRAVEISREGFSYPKAGDMNKLDRMFNKYQDPEEPDYMVEPNGLMNFCTDVGINPESLDVLVLQGLIGNEDFMVVQRSEFKEGLSKCGCSTKRDVKQRVEEVKQAILTRKKVLKGFASFLFTLNAESNRIRTLDLAQVPELLIVFQMLFVANSQYFVLAEQYKNFLQSRAESGGESQGGRSQGDDPKNLITKDDWVMTAEFVQETKELNQDVLDMADSWPNLISDFINQEMGQQ